MCKSSKRHLFLSLCLIVMQRNSLSVDDNIYVPLRGFEYSGEWINGYHLPNAKLF